MDLSLASLIILILFLLGYLAIIFEFFIKVNKAGIALLTAVVCWLFYFVLGGKTYAQDLVFLGEKLSDISQILFFLLGAMTLVELIDSHKGFNTVIEHLHTHSKRKMLWVISLISFFLSAVLDNLTTTILMISLLRKLIPYKRERLMIACMVVVAANAGGAWTPIGDVTTTMLWINGQLSTLAVMQELFIPSFISMIIPLILFTFLVKGTFPVTERDFKKDEVEHGGHVVFSIGVLGLIFVPIFKWLTGLPPFMGILISLAILWIITDLMHHKEEKRQHLRVSHILTKVDVSIILFFLGILLSIHAIEAIGILDLSARWLDTTIGNMPVIATIIGIVSAIIDNVPLVAATMGMYDLQTYPINSDLWMMIAYAAGTGGSIFIIGSSAGVALMGLEKVDFFSYMKKVSLPVFIGYIAGMLFYVFVIKTFALNS